MFRQVKYLLSAGLMLTMLCIGCSKSDSSASLSNVARVTAFSFNGQDTLPGLAEAKFVVDELNDTGRIYTPDSLRYGTKINKVVPKITYQTSPSAVRFEYETGYYNFQTGDTIDFTLKPLTLIVTSMDGSKKKAYHIETIVHKANPDLFTWKCDQENIYSTSFSEQQLVHHKDAFYLFSFDGSSTKLYTSSTGVTWQEVATNLPSTEMKVKNIFTVEDTLYYAIDSTLYFSTDGTAWKSRSTPDSLAVKAYLFTWTILGDIQIPILVAEKNDKSLHLVKMQNNEYVPVCQLSNNFPLSGFASVVFQAQSQRLRAMVMGGYDRFGNMLSSRWNFEYIDDYDGSDAIIRLADYSIGRNMSPISNTSLAWYNKKIYRFGGIDKTGKLIGDTIYQSTDEGISFQRVDTVSNKLPASFGARQRMNILVVDKAIYLCGGQTAEGNKNDFWEGTINSIKWTK